ncbi:MAG TPA: hypothetical protein VF659_08505 [Pyrinomonadaceae bacterium]|jgi:23S rRNA (guanine745-N1)-methyltransferase
MERGCPERFLICPVCDSPLLRVAGRLGCPNRHSFRVAEEGYVDLRLSGGGAESCGGNAEILSGPRGLSGGDFFAPLSRQINTRVYQHLADYVLSKNRPLDLCVLDAACGEGSLLGELKNYLDEQLQTERVEYLGVDASEGAVRRAAKRYAGVGWVAADLGARVPVAPDSIQVLLNTFAPRHPVEFAGVMPRGALLIVVVPNPRHLTDLLATLRLPNTAEDEPRRVAAQCGDAFRLADVDTVEYDLTLDGEEAVELIETTVTRRRLREDAAPIRSAKHLRARVGFDVLSFLRAGSWEDGRTLPEEGSAGNTFGHVRAPA